MTNPTLPPDVREMVERFHRDADELLRWDWPEAPDSSLVIRLKDYKANKAAFYRSAAAMLERLVLREPGWRAMPSERPGHFPHNGARVIVGWKALKGMPEHVELGRWRSGMGAGSGWCNTYGHSFGGVPDFYFPLPTPPKEGETDG